MNPNLPKHSASSGPALSPRLFGLVPTGGPGMTATTEGPIEILLMAILGSFIGLLLGFMLVQLSRFVSMFTGRTIGRFSWSAYGALAGAVAFAIFALVNGD
jgi:hypothetical protein